MRIGNDSVRNVRITRMFVTALLALPLLTVPGRSGQMTPKTFRGEVMDTFCAKNGSHYEMMARMQSMGRDKATCTKKCAEIGAKYVLYDEADKTVYNLDDQSKLEAFAGRHVNVTGTLDGDKINVT